jgi:hypothetical protein
MLWILLACTDVVTTTQVGPFCTDDCSLPGCETHHACTEDCADGIDNDSNGWVDCQDPECASRSWCLEHCSDGRDNDYDGFIDCQDEDCWEAYACREICEDGVDNDQDALIDCDDPDCDDDAACLEDCGDGVDNDWDGDIDCWDSDCAGKQAPCIEDCSDGVDNDVDGQLDCLDSECAGRQMPCIEACVDGLDNDLNGEVDCLDANCADLEICSENCQDGIDNDADGLVDCEDASCSFQCTEQLCTDGQDNNANGRIDCEDEDCWGLDGCAQATGIRVIQGEAEVEQLFWSSSPSGSWSQRRERFLHLSNPIGTAVVAQSSSNVQCHWWADQVTLGRQSFTYRSYTWSGRDTGTSQMLSFENFGSTGACSPVLLNAAFTTIDRNTYSHSVSWGHQIQLGTGYANLDGSRWVAGETSFVSSTTWGGNTRSRFEVDPLLTEPWIFGP